MPTQTHRIPTLSQIKAEQDLHDLHDLHDEQDEKVSGLQFNLSFGL